MKPRITTTAAAAATTTTTTTAPAYLYFGDYRRSEREACREVTVSEARQ